MPLAAALSFGAWQAEQIIGGAIITAPTWRGELDPERLSHDPVLQRQEPSISSITMKGTDGPTPAFATDVI